MSRDCWTTKGSPDRNRSNLEWGKKIIVNFYNGREEFVFMQKKISKQVGSDLFVTPAQDMYRLMWA